MAEHIPPPIEIPPPFAIPPAPPVKPTTTAEQDLRTAGQRQINLIWERSQRFIALFVVVAGMLVAAFVVLWGVVKGSGDVSLTLAAFTLLSSATFLVCGFYFGRTNHARIGDMPRRDGPLDDR